LSKPAIDPFCLPSVEGESYLGLSVSFFALRFPYFVTHGTASGKLILRSIWRKKSCSALRYRVLDSIMSAIRRGGSGRPVPHMWTPMPLLFAWERASERVCLEERVQLFSYKKILQLTNQNTKLNSDRTIKFVSINSSKQDLTGIYLHKVISRSHNG
jgi:hypothetical protein